MLDVFSNQVCLDLHPSVQIPVHAGGQRALPIAKHGVRSFARRQLTARAASETERFIAGSELHGAVRLAFSNERVGAAHIPALRDERRQITILDALPTALVAEADVLRLYGHAARLPLRLDSRSLAPPFHPHVGIEKGRAEHRARANPGEAQWNT